MAIVVPIRVLPHGEGLEIPAYATEGSAGCDLRAALQADLTITPGGRTLVPTGIAVAIPAGFVHGGSTSRAVTAHPGVPGARVDVIARTQHSSDVH